MGRLASLAVFAALVFASVALAANGGLAPDKYYNGKTSQKRPVHLIVNGTQLSELLIDAVYACDGNSPPTFEQTLDPVGKDEQIKHGSFKASFKSYDGGVGHFSGKFKGKRVSGSFSEVLPMGAETCKTGNITFEAKRGPRWHY